MYYILLTALDIKKNNGQNLEEALENSKNKKSIDIKITKIVNVIKKDDMKDIFDF